MPRKILVVDDNAINRQMLIYALQRDYDILEAENGRDALALMHRHYRMLSAVLLDIMMPEMDGYDVLRRVRENPLLSQIPIIMVTGTEDEDARVKALSLGANDFIQKPFNPEIVKHCLRNNIALRETASILNAIQRDKLTGLYNREAFFEKVSAMIRDRESGHYILSCFDIDNFKLINDQYGAGEGDRILKEIGAAVRAGMEGIGGIAGRISADNFAALFPAAEKDADILLRIRDGKLVTLEQRPVVFSVGRYVVTDLSLPASAIYDRTYLAKQSVKGRYDTHLAYFDETMLQKLVRDQQIVGEMEQALAERQFEVWFQPQYNHVNGAITGAEALVRWRHPRKGIVSPGEFIPLFEQNGFVYELDKYMWREACRYLRKWIDEGLAPLPISVNISRYDIFHADLIEVITGIVNEFDIPIELLRLEITESAFARSTKLIVDIVKKLIDLGFTIEIDDFGSGYSSLNTLKSVPAQVVKLDMRFLAGDDDAQRGGNILESIVRMAKWLGMPVIAEGVETKEQGDFLKSIGCSHVQGYLYARPMPAAEYEAHFRGALKETGLEMLETAGNFDNSMFWNPKSMDSLIFNSYVGSACIYEYCDGRLELLRATDKYARMLGGDGMTVDELLKLDLMAYLDREATAATLAAVEDSARSKGEVTGEFLFRGLPGRPQETYIRSAMRVVACAANRYLVYCINENVTAEKQAAQNLLENLPCGAGICAAVGDDARMTYLNRRYFTYFRHHPGAPRTASVYDAVHPDDRAALRAAIRPALSAGGECSCVVRILDGPDEYVSFRVSGVALDAGSMYVTFVPISHEELSFSEMLPIALERMMAASSDLSFVKDRDLRYICCSRSFARMVGLGSEKEIAGKTDHDLFDAALADRYVADDRRLLADGRPIVDMVESLPSEDAHSRYSSTSKYLLYDFRGEVVGLYGVGHDITRTREAEEQQKFLINNIPGGVAIYEGQWSTLASIRLTYFSDGFCRLFGYTREEYETLGAQNPTGLIEKEYLPGLTGQIEALVTTGAPIDYIYRAGGKGGSFRWIHVKAVPGERRGGNMTVNAVFFDVTEHQEALERLRVSEEENRLAIRLSRNMVCRYDVAARTLRTPAGADTVFALPALMEDVPYAQVKSGEVSPETADAYTKFYEDILRGEKSGSVVYQRRSAQGWRWLEAQSSTIFSSAGAPLAAVISFLDVTESFEKEAAYKKWRQSLHTKKPEAYSLFRCSVSKKTVFDTTEGSLLRVRFAPGPFSFDEHTAEYTAQCVAEEDRERFRAFLCVDALLEKYYRGERVAVLEYRESLPEGGTRWLRLTTDLVEYPHSADVEAYLLFEDIDEAKRAELLTRTRAETDPLTGILNRTTFAERVDERIRAAEPGTRHALLMLDLDGFKFVNDVFGHGAGDQTLIDIAELLRTVLRRDDLVGRLGGDEFVVFLSGIPTERVAADKARRICELCRKSFSAQVQISGSVGIAVHPHDGADFDTLYRKADRALYHVKGSGRDSFAFYQEDMEDERLTPPPASAPGTARLREKKRRMLIVDDSRIDCALLANLFQGEFMIEKAKDGAAALVRLRHYGAAISVVLLDLIMPGMDGFAVLAHMQGSPELRAIPVVVVSGANDREASLRAIRGGASDYVTKPVDADILRIRVQSAISKAENERLRAKNSLLELQSAETIRYEAVLGRLGLAVVEMDWGRGAFTYSPSVSAHLSGNYDGRTLWHILMSDMVADTRVVREIQQLIHSVADDRGRTEGSLTAPLRAASGKRRRFEIHAYKQANAYGLTNKMILTFRALDGEGPGEEPAAARDCQIMERER